MTTAAPEQQPNTAQALAAWRARSADPVRLRFIEAMARRAAGHQGAARRLLDNRLQQLLASAGQTASPALGSALAAAPTGQAAAVVPGPQSLPKPKLSALAKLLAHIASHTTNATTEAQAQAFTAVPELKAVRDYRDTWSRLVLEQRLRQALAKVPDNAGPLNTQRLLHQALVLMQDAAPQYLARFVAQVETLLWLEHLNTGRATPKKMRVSKP